MGRPLCDLLQLKGPVTVKHAAILDPHLCATRPMLYGVVKAEFEDKRRDKLVRQFEVCVYAITSNVSSCRSSLVQPRVHLPWDRRWLFCVCALENLYTYVVN